MIKIEKRIENVHMFLLISIVILCDYMRIFIFKTALGSRFSQFGNINIIAGAFVIYILFVKIKQKKINIFLLWINALIGIFVMISILFSSMKNYFIPNVTVWVNTILILNIIGINICELIDFKKLIRKIIKIMNYCMIAVVFIGCLDYLSGFAVQKLLSKYYFLQGYFTEDILRNMNGFYRYFSIWGHPLRLGGMILIIFALNIVYTRYYGKLTNINFIAIVSLIGACLANSKASIVGVIGLVILMAFRNKKGRLIKIIISILFLVILFNTSFFQETILNRFLNTDLTTGRSEIVNYMFTGYIPTPHAIGEGVGYSYYVSNMTGLGALSFEYPPIMFSYDYGIICTILIYIVLFIYPMFMMIKRKQWLAICCYGIVFLQYNTHAAIVVKEDAMIQLVFFIYLLLNIIYDNDKKVEIKN